MNLQKIVETGLKQFNGSTEDINYLINCKCLRCGPLLTVFLVNLTVLLSSHPPDAGHSVFVLFSELHFVTRLAPSTACVEELSLTLPSPLLDNELTVGKVYAALMIFDYYKQNRAKRLQQQNPSTGPTVCWRKLSGGLGRKLTLLLNKGSGTIPSKCRITTFGWYCL